MRLMQDPERQAMALALYRTGLKHNEVAAALDMKPQTIKQEMEHDPLFKDAVQQAMREKFEPVLQRALELALKADAEGDFEGAHKALALVFKYYGNQLDRDAARENIVLKAQAQAEIEARRPVTPGLNTEEAVREYMATLPVFEAESWEDDDE